MVTDPGDDDERRPPGPPLPPDDRLWRHPSELAGLSRGPVPAPVGPGSLRSSRPAAWVVPIVAGLAGAGLATGALAATGTLSPRVVERSVVEKVAVTPLLGSPLMRASDDLAALARRVEPSVVRLDVRGRDGTMASGSGIVYRDDGLVLTSARLVGTGAALDVVLSDGRRLEATLVGRDPLTDVAVVDVDADHLMVAVLGTVEGLEVGAPAVAVGAPTTDGGSLLLAPGMISALERRMEAEPGVVLHGLVQTDAPTAAGAAGGALVDATGSVVALTTAGPAGRGSAFGYAVPIDLVRRVAERIVDQGEMVHPWLGIEGADLSAAEASRLGVAGGALVRSVVAGSPAEQAGLRAGDVITEIDAEAVQSISTVIVALRDHDPGEALAVGYWRAGAHHEATVTVAARPPG